MPFLPPNQQRQSTEGKVTSLALSCKLVGVFAMIFAVLLQNQAQGSVALYHFQSLPSDLAVVALHCGGPSLWLTTIIGSQQLAF